MGKRERIRAMMNEEMNESSFPLIEEVFEKRIDEVVTILGCGGNGRDGVYDEVLSMVEKALIKIAMKRSNNVKTAAADFLGINRNTLHGKIKKLKI
ncbi:MAG: helix-turn-helix domain-containing protein [Deltaproteobacteria bacterium]|nr:helix-turn-helix domain-containing protein [Deltaproteobacteria bacterium]MBW2673691.1 helix-turn-helix domain-containing protein [Deltaproteobacteria bacterium]